MKTATNNMIDFMLQKSASVKFSKEDAIKQLKSLNYDIEKLPFPIDDFVYGMNVELEHGTERGEDTNVTDDNPLATAKITLAHLKESPHYYKELKKMESRLEVTASEMIEIMIDGARTRADDVEKTAKLNDNIEFNPLQQRVLDNPSGSIIAAHPVGSGKTLTGIAKFEKLKEEGRANKALVVVPASLRHNFGNEGVAKFTDSSYNIVGNKQEISKKTGNNINPNADYNIVSYEMFRKNPEQILKDSGADTIIQDEMHKLKNEGTSTIDSFHKIKGKYKNMIGLTGSVISNKISDVYNLADLAANGSHALGRNKKDFEKMYLKRSTSSRYKDLRDDRKPVIGFNNRRKLKNELNKYIDYADIDDIRDSAKIPEKSTHLNKVQISPQQAKIYKKIVKNNPSVKKLIYQKRLETMKDDEVAKAFNDLIEARKLMNSVGSVIPGIDLTESARMTPKTKKMLDDLEVHLKNTPDGQAILLTNLINGGADVLEAGLKDRGLDYGRFLGKGNDGITEEGRQQDVRDYKKRKKNVMIISGAGAEGISLGNTTWEGVLDPHYNPERMNQMEARGIRAYGLSHRPEKDRVVDVERYISTMPKKFGIFNDKMKTPDEFIYEIAQNKDKQNQLLFDLLKESKKR